MTTKNKYIAIALLLLASVSVLPSCHSGQKEGEAAADSAEAPVATEVITIQKGKLATTLQVPGELLPYQEVDLYAKVNSFVKKLLVDVGSEVQQGQLLVTLDAPEINSQLAGARSRIQQQQAIYL